MAVAERITFTDFQKRFKTEEQCREYLFRQRFPDGFVCPSCGAKEYYPIYRRNLSQCKKCRKQTSVTSGTVMHRTHLSLVLWFWAIYLCVNDKRGISASQLSRMLEIGYESAWYLLKRIRKAMGQRDSNYLLSGLMLSCRLSQRSQNWKNTSQCSTASWVGTADFNAVMRPAV